MESRNRIVNLLRVYNISKNKIYQWKGREAFTQKKEINTILSNQVLKHRPRKLKKIWYKSRDNNKNHHLLLSKKG
jgi:hypothetical protein